MLFTPFQVLFPNYSSSIADPDPDPYVFGPPGSRSISKRYGSGSFYHQAKIVKKSGFLLFSDFLSLKNDVMCPQKVISRITVK